MTLDIVYLDRKYRTFYNGIYMGYLLDGRFYIPMATRKYVEHTRQTLKLLHPNITMVWQNGFQEQWKGDCYGKEEQNQDNQGGPSQNDEKGQPGIFFGESRPSRRFP